MKIKNMAVLKDGGSIMIWTDDLRYWYDYRIRTETPGQLFSIEKDAEKLPVSEGIFPVSEGDEVELLQALKNFDNKMYGGTIARLLEEKKKLLRKHKLLNIK